MGIWKEEKKRLREAQDEEARRIQYQEIETILQFMYLGEVRFSKKRIHKFITVGENLEVKGLSNQVAVNESDPDNLSDLDECLAKEEPLKYST